MATSDNEKERIRRLVNNLNLGTRNAGVGDLFLAMLNRIEQLEAAAGGGGSIEAGSLALLQAGEDEEQRTWSAKDIADFVGAPG